jgi:peptidoglycan/LPS O-acetylase OafA/YrhL
VLLDHARYALHLAPSAGTSTGQHGVTLFFVLSGFLITSRLMHEKETTGRVDLRKFYVQRFFRLMPCAWAFLWFAFVASMMSPERSIALPNFLSAIFFCRNYSPLFAPDLGLTGHFWSLSIEEQFYLVWPTVLILAGTRRARWIAIAGAVLIAAYRWHCWASLAHLALIYTVGTHLRADALLIGCVTALSLPTLRPRLRNWMVLPLLAGLACCMAHYHGLIPLHESLIIALLLAITSSCSSAAFQVLEQRPLVFLGTISYSLYVWQQPFMQAVHNDPHALPIAAILLPVTAVASYYYIEKPFIARGHRLTEKAGQHSHLVVHVS